MRRLQCRCEHAVFFDNHYCGNCGRQLAFDAATLEMQSEINPGDGLDYCSNRFSAIGCNWLAEPDNINSRCISCRSSDIIPSLSNPDNFERWRKLEAAKRRFLYNALSLGLPVKTGELRFVFKEDQRTNPDVHEQHVNIGHAQGVITINAAEADDVYREQMRVLNNEPYRTLLGHFRHEAGHFYFSKLIDDGNRPLFRQLFGNELAPYDAALRNYYEQGPRADWQSGYISAYASAHPSEDWAETFAHYLHILAMMETARSTGLADASTSDDWERPFIDLVVGLNELMRSLGLADAYPFVITPIVANKIQFVREAVAGFTGRPVEPLFAAG